MNMKLTVVALFSLMSASFSHAANRNILWQKVHDQCLPAYTLQDKYAPCTIVNLEGRYVIFKVDVDNDKYQYLLLPTNKVTGIEDRQLLSNTTPRYFYQAWDARMLIPAKLGGTIQEKNISLTVNAINSRSQDQLHIHISCLAAETRIALDRIDFTGVDYKWHRLLQKLNGETYSFKKLTLQQFKDTNLFQAIEERVIAEGKEMQYTTAAVI